MLVDKVQSTPQPSFRALKIITTPHIIEVAEKNLDKNIILAIQQAGELLGAPKAPNSTKFFDLIITQNN